MAGEPRVERKVERPVRWSEVTILAAKTNEQLNTQRREPLTEQQLQNLRRLSEILRSADAVPKALLYWIEATRRQSQRTMQWDALADLAGELSPRVHIGELNYRQAPNGSKAVDEQNINITAQYLERVPTHDVITLSDSHTATSYTLMAAERNSWDLSHTAVLSFDRHSDYMPEEEYSGVKATVMSDLLKRTHIPAVAVVGTYYQRRGLESRTDQKTIDFLSGSDVITKGGPDHAAFEQWIAEQVMQWREQGVHSIYPTVDLDSLRLYEQGYTGMDYNPTRDIVQLLKTGELEKMITEYQGGDVSELVRKIKFQLDTRELSGIPASWIGRALDIAKQHGMQIGITHPNGSRRLVGDVVEYLVPDEHKRTGKIARALMQRLASVAQQR